ncbi:MULTISPECIES: IS5 family transposase [Rhodomicrobium]|uniref:IS5 family transposase n=1 Tax=Rhodomicrobium TaxID=1068 RepID=UPI001FD939A3|nr:MULTISPECIES: IS5 family transposase [Rhodomicrobium]
MHKQVGQRGFVDQLLEQRSARKAHLARIASLIDWAAIDRLAAPIYASQTGRPSYPPLVMIKALLLAQWYGLSDPGLEEALDDTLSFRAFAGLSLQDAVPDHSTICRFRQQLQQHNLSEAIFCEVGRQLEARNLIVKRGTLIDATLIEAQAAKPGFDQGRAATSTVDKDADWTRKAGKSHFGYKAHIAVDQHSGLIRKAILTPASVNDSEVADALILGDEGAVYADKAYEQRGRRQRLKGLGIKDRIMHRSHKNQTGLPRWQRRRNRLIAPIRAAIERVFGTLKRSYDYRRVRFFDLARNAVDLNLLCVAFNLRKAAAMWG